MTSVPSTTTAMPPETEGLAPSVSAMTTSTSTTLTAATNARESVSFAFTTLRATSARGAPRDTLEMLLPKLADVSWVGKRVGLER